LKVYCLLYSKQLPVVDGNNMSAVEKNFSLVLIHGWGCDQASWQPLIPELEKFFKIISIDLPGFGNALIMNDYSLENILSILIDQIPSNSWVMGWSLGGMLAIQLAHSYPQKISGVVSLAANAKFVADDDYPDAMPLQVNQDFNQSFLENPAATLKLFSGLLAQGAEDERGLLKTFRRILNSKSINSNWYDALLLLSQIDNRKLISEIEQSCLHIFAEGD
jgi:malonyl-CoA O-methyltransferase